MRTVHLLQGEVLAPVASTRTPLSQVFFQIIGDYFRERDNRSFKGGREVVIDFTRQSTKFDEIRSNDTIVTEELPAVVLDLCTRPSAI